MFNSSNVLAFKDEMFEVNCQYAGEIIGVDFTDNEENQQILWGQKTWMV